MITLMEAEQRVGLGAYFLDLIKPEWRNTVDPASLQVNSGLLCPLGQCFGSYAKAIDDLMLGDEVVELGFYSHDVDDYSKLDMAWGRELAGV